MAKYKFTRTLKPGQGICIDADGTVSGLQTTGVLSAARESPSPGSDLLMGLAPGKPILEERTQHSSGENVRKGKISKWGHKSCNVSSGPVLVRPQHAMPAKIVVPLSSPTNPYYGERAMYRIPPARPCGMFGPTRPRPISRSAAMSFQHDYS